MLPESLHTHTIISDGAQTPREAFDYAEKLGIGTVAFTEHDVVWDDESLAYLESRRDSKTKWVLGVEITCTLPKDITSQKSAHIHLVGLFVNHRDPVLLDYCKRAQHSRLTRMRNAVKEFTDIGFKMSEEEILEIAGPGSVGKPHIVKALLSHPENEALLEEWRQNMEHDAQNKPALKEAYDRMMAIGPKQYPYGIFLSSGAYRPIRMGGLDLPDLDEAVALIRGAGGIASLAHYFTLKESVSLDIFEKFFTEKRIDGAEIIYGINYHDTPYEKEMQEDQKRLTQMIEEHGGLATGGSDAHSAEDMKKFVDEKWFSKKTIGLTEKIIASGRVNTKWSSY